MYQYHSELIRVIDGDTVEAMVDLGFSTWKKVTIRLNGLDAPESRTKDLEEKAKGLAAKEFLTKVLEESDNKFILLSLGVDKFGRCLGELYLTLNGTSVNTLLLTEGYAVEYHGEKR